MGQKWANDITECKKDQTAFDLIVLKWTIYINFCSTCM